MICIHDDIYTPCFGRNQISSIEDIKMTQFFIMTVKHGGMYENGQILNTVDNYIILLRARKKYNFLLHSTIEFEIYGYLDCGMKVLFAEYHSLG